jgi:antitoxin (DNA-binding transcriptional repressor) of toxin-antitoxin stability system
MTMPNYGVFSIKEEVVPTITLADAQARLPTLIATLKPGEELLIVDGDRPVARLVGEAPAGRQARKPGSAIGELTIIKEDDEHLEDFKEYMP